MAQGRSNRAIGERLFLSPKTVETHVGAIFAKLGLLPATDDYRASAGCYHLPQKRLIASVAETLRHAVTAMLRAYSGTRRFRDAHKPRSAGGQRLPSSEGI